LLTWFVLAALPAFAALTLLTRLCLTALLAALAALLLLAGLALAALLRIVLTLLVALRILLLVSHFGRSPVSFEKAPPGTRTIRNFNRGSRFHCNYFQQLFGKTRKNAYFGAGEKFPQMPTMTAVVGFAARGCPC